MSKHLKIYFLHHILLSISRLWRHH